MSYFCFILIKKYNIMAKYTTEKVKGWSLVDEYTGELLEYKQTKKINIDEFIMVFVSSCPRLIQLNGLHLKVLICCWKFSTFNPINDETGNVVYNGRSFKEFCAREGLGSSPASIDNAISELCKQGLLLRKHKSEYLLNPEYFFKGTLSKRSKINMDFIVDPKQN